MTETLRLDGQSLTLDQFLAVVRDRCAVGLASEARAAMAESRDVVERAVRAGRPVYGVTTGFGALSDRMVPPDRGRELQRSLIRSHASGVGRSLPADVVRGMILLRANSLARGRSGVRADVVEALLGLLNRGLVPWIPESGSVGASGDLAPLAHLALALIGEGTFVGPDGHPVPAAEALARAGLAPLDPAEKEGLALLNGTALMASYLALAVAEARALLDAALLAAALSYDALQGDPGALDDRLGELRNAPDERAIAQAMRALLDGSQLAVVRTTWTGQDPYTLRCIPQVLAAVRVALSIAAPVAERELNAVTDNPVIGDGDEFLNGGNFHGQSLAFALDTLALGVQYIAGFSERRTARLLHPALNRGLPAFLAADPGASSGFMISHTVQAALVNENATLVHPASATSLPTSADQEDFVSMGAWAGAKLARVLANARRVVAVEWIVAGQALEHRRPKSGGRGSESALRALRRRVPPWVRDRSATDEIERLAESIATGDAVGEVRADVPF